MSVNPPPTQVLKRETLADRVLAQLRRQILSGALAPGQRLPSEQDLSLAFGVGRTTIREALQIMLAHDIGALLVVDGDGKLLGIFSERDLLTKVAGLHASRVDGSALEYNRADPRLPDLVVCRKDLAGRLLAALDSVTAV